MKFRNVRPVAFLCVVVGCAAPAADPIKVEFAATHRTIVPGLADRLSNGSTEDAPSPSEDSACVIPPLPTSATAILAFSSTSLRGDLRTFGEARSGPAWRAYLLGEARTVQCAGAGLRELQVFESGIAPTWSANAPDMWKGASIAPLVPDHADLAPAGSGSDDDADATCATAEFHLPVNPGSIQRAALNFFASGMGAHWEIGVTLNGHVWSQTPALWSHPNRARFSVELPAEQLVWGTNQLKMCGPLLGVSRVRVEQASVAWELEQAPVAAPNEPNEVVLDGDPSTGTTAASFVIPMARDFELLAVLVHGTGLSGTWTVEVDGATVPVRTEPRERSALLMVPWTRGVRTISLHGPSAVRVEEIQLVAPAVGAGARKSRLVMTAPQQGRYFGDYGIVGGWVSPAPQDGTLVGVHSPT
jgi:hypothetical protein